MDPLKFCHWAAVIFTVRLLLIQGLVTLFLLQEQELKAAADGVLSEVRKKQADTKRMVDILRALEKLRKLRKEAAARKGNYSFAFLLTFLPSPYSFPTPSIFETKIFAT
jgi:hypothetical protein